MSAVRREFFNLSGITFCQTPRRLQHYQLLRHIAMRPVVPGFDAGNFVRYFNLDEYALLIAASWERNRSNLL